MSEENSAEEPTLLTDENVAILYQIIKSAEQHPNVDTLPFRAIFAAYETILHENGLDPDHDQIYLRFLFRLGDTREEGQSLYERFEALLEELGFQIEFVPDEDGIQGAAKSHDSGRDRLPPHTQMRETWRHPRRSRRNSFTSLYDAGDEDTEEIRSRPRSRASMSRLEITERSALDARPSTRATTRKTEKTPTYASPSKSQGLPNKRGRLTAEEFARNLQHLNRRHVSSSGQPDPRKQQPATNRAPSSHFPTGANPSTGDIGQASRIGENHDVEVSATPRPEEPRYAISQHEQLYNPSRTQLFRDAETFHHYRIRSVARDIVDRWCYAALQARDQHQHLDRLAAAHDAEILLRQAFEHWRIRLHAKKQALATEKYFYHEEKRITRARDLMLSSKAFTHWAQCASDERLRTTDARQKILSMKYLRAWRDITIANHLNVRHQRLRKLFEIWKKRYDRSLREGARAELVRHENIVRNVYWDWFWAFCERRAPEWRAGRLRRKYLSQWIVAFRGNRRRDLLTNLQVENAMRKRVFTQWMEKARVINSGQREAIHFCQQKEAARALQSWRRSHIYASRYQQVSNMIDWRVAGATFAIFVARYRYERQAEAVNRLRIMRNAFTQWNDRLRWQTVAHRIDDRFCLEALYKWVVLERRSLLQRLSDERLKQRYLYKLKEGCDARRLQRTRSLLLIEDARRERYLQYYLNRWHSRLVFCHQDERIAFQFHAPRLAQDALQPWRQIWKHQQKMDGLAKDTDFYFTARRFLKRWRAALLGSKKQKRKNAYVQVRRKQKMTLARVTLQHWHNMSTRLHDLEQQAELANQNRLLNFGASLFDYWLDKSNTKSDQDYQALQHYDRRLVERYLYTWIKELENQSKLEELAEINLDMRVRNVAFGCFNRLRLRIIELKGQEANAENLRRWYEKRHFRGMLRQWQDATAKKVNPQWETAFTSEVSKTKPPAVLDEGPTSQAEDWTEFDVRDWIPALEAQSSSTPMPGYLSTPSKRAARAKALVKVSTTPVGTPFEQRLRSQLGSTPRTARRGGLGRSAGALRGSTFGAILEDSPRTPDPRREG